MNRLVLLLAALSTTACLRGSGDLVAGTNARVIVTGLVPGDAVLVEVGAVSRAAIATTDDPLVVYLELENGVYEGRATLAHGAHDLCATFDLDVEPFDVDVASIDVATAHPCTIDLDGGVDDAGDDDAGEEPFDAGAFVDAGAVDGGPRDAGAPDDAGPTPPDAGQIREPPVLAAFAEDVDPLTCVVGVCLIRTSILDDGTVAYTALGAATIEAQIGIADVEALAARALSDDADALFAGQDPTCPQPRPALSLDQATLRRTIDGPDDDGVEETIDVTGCDEGIAKELRVRVRQLRELAGLPL